MIIKNQNILLENCIKEQDISLVMQTIYADEDMNNSKELVNNIYKLLYRHCPLRIIIGIRDENNVKEYRLIEFDGYKDINNCKSVIATYKKTSNISKNELQKLKNHVNFVLFNNKLSKSDLI